MAKNIFRGQTTVNNIYRGNTPLSKVYKGNTEIWSAAEAGPPVTADVFDFRASSYSGTGDWIDEVAGYGADLIGSPTFVDDGLSSYWELNSSTEGFSVPREELPDALFDTMDVGTNGIAEGAFEFVFNADAYTDQNSLLTMWDNADSNRMILIGNITATNLNTSFQTVATGTGDRSYINHNITIGTGNWKHIVITFSMADDYIDLYINGSSVSSKTWTSTNEVWNGANVCLALALRQDNCGSNQRAFDGKYAVARGYNDKLLSSDISSLYSFWSNYYSFA